MVKLDYKLDKKKLECLYIKTLFSTKFGRGKNSLTVKKKFDELIKEYPYDVIFCDISFSDIIFVKPENIKCLINKVELRIIEQSKIEYKTIKKKKKFIYEAKNGLKDIFNYEKKISKFYLKIL